jgi:hypothetical protein
MRSGSACPVSGEARVVWGMMAQPANTAKLDATITPAIKKRDMCNLSPHAVWPSFIQQRHCRFGGRSVDIELHHAVFVQLVDRGGVVGTTAAGDDPCVKDPRLDPEDSRLPRGWK